MKLQTVEQVPSNTRLASPDEVAALADALNDVDTWERDLFGDSVNAAIVRHVKAATLQDSSVSIRGLGRVLGLEPSTVRRRVSKLLDAGWLERTGDQLTYSSESLQKGRLITRKVLLRMARVYRLTGWGNPAPPER